MSARLYGRDADLAAENAAELDRDDWLLYPTPPCGIRHMPEPGNVRACLLPCEPRHTRHEAIFRGEVIHWDTTAKPVDNPLSAPGEFPILTEGS